MSNPFALVIEDNQDLATIFALALKMAGFETEIIQSGDKALARLAVLTPNLVIMDAHLPGAPGVEILHHIRADGRLAKTYVIAVTGDPFIAEEIQNQADLVLLKPFSFDRLQNLATCLVSGAPADECNDE